MQRRIIIVIGPSGSGKTRTVSELVDKFDRVAVFDKVKDEQYSKKKNAIVIEGKPRDFGRAIELLTPEDARKNKFLVVYHPQVVEVESNGLLYSPEFGPIVRACHERGDMYLVIDEAHLWCNSYNCPTELMEANLIGRHQEFSLILVAQRFNGIHPAIRENADEYYFYKVIQPASLKMIADICGDETAIKVQELRAVEVDENNTFKKPGQRLHWTKFGGVVEVTP
jgi:AAA domain